MPRLRDSELDSLPKAPASGDLLPGHRCGQQQRRHHYTVHETITMDSLEKSRKKRGVGLRSYLLMAVSRSLANSFQDLLKSLVLFPFGHHCTLPRPMIGVPRSSLPLRTSSVSELLLALFVNSTDDA